MVLSKGSMGLSEVIVDAMFGYGLSRPLAESWAQVAFAINQAEGIVVSIDIPSGIFAHEPSPGPHVHADFTLTFQCPKLAFFVPENQDAIGEWIVLDIGLDSNMLKSLETTYHMVDDAEIANALPVRNKFDHKGVYGHAMIVAGSFGKIGAAILAAKAALRTGLGLLTVHVPRQAAAIMHIAVPEAMVSADRHDYNFSGVDHWPKISALGLGCGLGLHGCTTTGIRDLLKRNAEPMIIDADGINTIAASPELIDLIPAGSILTPHLKEFSRLFGESGDHFERLQRLKEASVRHQLVIVLKGAHTAVALPDGTIHFNTTGNPGMATAGSGDVLTGMITSLVAQGLAPGPAAIAGVYLHGLAGDIAARYQGASALIASDIVDHIGEAFQEIQRV